MKSVFMALWCFCFMLIAVIGCDQGMNMMKPAVQDVMGPESEDKPEAEVEQDMEVVEPTVPEPDVEEPPMVVEETPVEPSDITEEMPEDMAEVLEDPYTPLGNLIVSNGGIQLSFPFRPEPGPQRITEIGPGDGTKGSCVLGGPTINGVRLDFHYSSWQRRDDAESAWDGIPDTTHGGICGYSPANPGQYRLVCTISLNGVRGEYTSANILMVE